MYDCCLNVAVYYCYYTLFHLLQKDSAAGRSSLLKSVHCLPNNGEMWLKMASLLLLWNKEYASNASFCTKVSNFHGGSREEASQVFALCQISIGYRKGALSAAQKAVHINPGKYIYILNILSFRLISVAFISNIMLIFV